MLRHWRCASTLEGVTGGCSTLVTARWSASVWEDTSLPRDVGISAGGGHGREVEEPFDDFYAGTEAAAIASAHTQKSDASSDTSNAAPRLGRTRSLGKPMPSLSVANQRGVFGVTAGLQLDTHRETVSLLESRRINRSEDGPKVRRLPFVF